MGNSSGVIIPKPLLREIGAKVGDQVELVVEGGKLVLAPVKAHPRAGWAEDSKALAEAGEGLAWPEFGNVDDEKLSW
jgi:antitoxin MazE